MPYPDSGVAVIYIALFFFLIRLRKGEPSGQEMLSIDASPVRFPLFLLHRNPRPLGTKAHSDSSGSPRCLT